MRPSLLLVAATLSAPTALAAQGPLTPRLGVLAGYTSATLGGRDVESTEGVLDTRHHNGVVAGVSLTVPLPGVPLALRPELLYSQKGIRGQIPYYTLTSPLTSPAVVGTTEFTDDLDYVELPVLAQVETPRVAGLRPALYAGPALGYRVRCRVAVTSGGTTDSSGCDDEGNDGPRRFDVSGVVGGQLGFALGPQAVGVGVRYTFGFTNIARAADVKNRALSVYGTIEFPFPSRR